jgi:hypothetical protein
VVCLLKFAPRLAWMRNLKLYISIICLVILFSSALLQSAQIYGQSNQFSASNTCTDLPVKGISASGTDPLNPPSNAIDQNVNTRWSNLGLGSWIQLDLGQENIICSVGINWHRGNERVNSFVISISKDGKTFTNVLSGKSDGISLAEQNYNLQSKTGRFIRVMITGNTQNNWVSISELNVYGYKPISESCVTSPVLKVTGPSSQVAYQPSNVIDNNLNTIWSNYGIGSSVVLDLGSSKTVCSVDIAWYKGNERQNNFAISTSLDGVTYKSVLTAKSSGNILSFEKYAFSDNLARYVKIIINGNTQNNYASIAEIRVQVPMGSPEIKCADSPIQNVKTSGSQTSLPGLNVIDDDLNTRWSNLGVGSWIQLDLGTTKKICNINIAWYKGNERQNSFVISASNDGVSFSNVFSGKSSGSTVDLEKYNVDDTNARYIKVTVNGNNQNTWASISEISVDVVSISGATFDIGAAGDWGSSNNDNWKKTVQLMIDNNVELALGLGDYSYGSINEFQPVVDRLKDAGIPMKGGRGDHDSDSYAGLFGQPSMVYAFDAGSARIILIDSYKSPSSNAAFLEKELIATKQQWKIVVTTTPLYTSPSVHDADDDQTRALQPLLDKYRVDLVMWGDNHNYERIQLPNKSTVFIQAGTAGRSHYDFEGRMAGSIYQNDNDYGITKLMFSGNALTGQFITHGGKVLDTFNIIK